MLFEVFVLFSLISSVVQTAVFEQDNQSSDGRIVGGEKSPIHYPYQVSLQIKSSGPFSRKYIHICGGSILSSTHFLTAAHCVENIKVSRLSALVGTSDLRNINNGSSHSVVSCLVHPKYIKLNTSDIALCKVNPPFQYGLKVGKIDFDKTFIGTNVSGILTGWGSIVSIRWLPIPFYSLWAYPDDLRRAILPTISNQQCKNSYPIDDTQICTYLKVGQGACAGDSGGPLAFNGKVIGIVSYGSNFCATGMPDVYTRVSYFYDWINLNMVIPSASAAMAEANAAIQSIVETLPEAFEGL